MFLHLSGSEKRNEAVRVSGLPGGGGGHFSRSHADQARWCNISLLMCNILSLNRLPHNNATQVKSHYGLCRRHHDNILLTTTPHS